MTVDRGVAEFVQQVEGHLLALPWRTRAAIRSDPDFSAGEGLRPVS
jgi:hypothetical protein